MATGKVYQIDGGDEQRAGETDKESEESQKQLEQVCVWSWYNRSQQFYSNTIQFDM